MSNPQDPDPTVPEATRRGRQRWAEAVQRAFAARPPWKRDFTTVSGAPVELLAGPDTLAGFDPERDLGWPGEYPYTRGVQATGYRGKLWTMRQFAGYGTAKQTNERFHYLLDHGQTGLSTAFHLPTLYGYDSDHEMSRGEVGKCGVAVDSLRDMEILFDRIDLGRVTTSMTINSTAPIALAMYLAVARKHGTSWDRVGGTLQNDILKEYIAQKEYIFPPPLDEARHGPVCLLRAARPPVEHDLDLGVPHPRGGVDRPAGARLHAARRGRVRSVRDRGRPSRGRIRAPALLLLQRTQRFLRGDREVPGRPAHLGEDDARAIRREGPRSWMCRFHTQTAGCSLTVQQPYNNVVRIALQALAGVLGGTNSLHTNSLDEALALPTDFAVKLALRTQQVIAHESGVANTIDPLGGSYFVEDLTRTMERGCADYFRRIDDLGGMVEAIEAGFPQREIMDAAYAYQRAVDAKEKIVVGVNDFVEEHEEPIDTLTIDEAVEGEQKVALAELRRTRDGRAVASSLRALEQACSDGRNVMPPLIDAVETYATVGEISDVMRGVFATYEEPAVY